MKKNTHLSVVIPAYNEMDNFNRGCLEEVNNYLLKQSYSWEVILVDDGSLDQTLTSLQSFSIKHKNFKVISIPHGGKVAAVTKGIQEAEGEVTLFTDFDQSTPIHEVGRVIEKFQSGADVVIAQRNAKIKRTFIQALRSKVFNFLVQLLLLPGIKDSQCGFKAFRSSLAKQLFERLLVTQRAQKGSYMGAFDVEVLFLARKLGFKIASIDVEWVAFKSDRLKLSEPFKMLRDVLKVRVADLLEKYPQTIYQSSRRKFFWQTLPVMVILLLSVPSFIDTIKPGYYPMQDDLQAMRQLIMDKCFKDFQVPCRWSVDMGYGFGYPLFNFYPPIPYLIGEFFRIFNFSIINVSKIVVILNLIVSGLTMYLLAKEFWGRWGGVISAIFFVYAPYHAVDIYVRGAINEAWAIVWFPAIYWGLYKIIATNKWKYVALTACFTALLMLSHNLMLMIFAPTAAVWALFWLIQKRTFKPLIKLIVAGVWALSLAAFFTLPVIFEQKFVHIETLTYGYFNYLAHFTTLNELFISRFWGYGDSRFGPVDDMSFQFGHLHLLLMVAATFAAIKLYKNNKQVSLMIFLLLIITTFYTFMSHQQSARVWELLSFLKIIQFPWRFLSYSIFGASFLAGSVVYLFKFKNLEYRKITISVLLIFSIFFYKDYFIWRMHWPWVDDKVKFAGELWRLQITASIFDYLPIWAPMPPADPPVSDVELIEGTGKVTKLFKNSSLQRYRVNMEEGGIARINTFYFPGWEYFIDGKPENINPYDDKRLGRPQLAITKGSHIIEAKLNDTPVRKLGNILSIVAWLSLSYWTISQFVSLKILKKYIIKS